MHARQSPYPRPASELEICPAHARATASASDSSSSRRVTRPFESARRAASKAASARIDHPLVSAPHATSRNPHSSGRSGWERCESRSSVVRASAGTTTCGSRCSALPMRGASRKLASQLRPPPVVHHSFNERAVSGSGNRSASTAGRKHSVFSRSCSPRMAAAGESASPSASMRWSSCASWVSAAACAADDSGHRAMIRPASRNDQKPAFWPEQRPATARARQPPGPRSSTVGGGSCLLYRTVPFRAGATWRRTSRRHHLNVKMVPVRLSGSGTFGGGYL